MAELLENIDRKVRRHSLCPDAEAIALLESAAAEIRRLRSELEKTQAALAEMHKFILAATEPLAGTTREELIVVSHEEAEKLLFWASTVLSECSGQPLLDRLAAAEKVVEAARVVVGNNNSAFGIQPLREALAAYEKAKA